ncbi:MULTISPECIES: Gfo/Idh/MocA family oxidoreductase [unclassified Ensifer]|uniref:Gfo/Idh/MocA family protein n=1 Tax=unclassified Ensifer TaxID=2633371 RepID=UPI000813222B|nr:MULTISPECIES: Gfo/Idh/MocA family oxidoreductase [unclassified Ensifer]OCP25139.1 oxidoreductase [Ensifer sp. LC54]OCP25528.1 oxidoreductase [Ensifer sp. LC384]
MAKVKGALIGCGFFAVNQMHGWKDLSDVEIVAICDRDPERLRLVGDQFSIARRYLSAEAMFADGGFDFVDIATTVGSHRALVELAASSKVPAICQKPFAPTLEDAKAMVKIAEKAGIALMIHENFRWQTPILAIKDVLASGAIGVPFWGRISFRSGFDVFSGQPYLAKGERFIIEDLGIHSLDIARFLFGDASRMTARTARINPTIAGEDVATMLLDHDNGITSIVDVSYATKLPEEPFPETFVEIDGSKGTLRLGKGYRLTVHSPDGTTESVVAPNLLPWASRPWHNIQESVALIQKHWIERLASGQQPDTSGRDNLKTFALVEAAYLSAARGETVAVGDLLA